MSRPGGSPRRSGPSSPTAGPGSAPARSTGTPTCPAGLVGGANQAPSPTAYLLGALAASAVAYTHDALAPEFGVSIEELSTVAGCSTDLARLLGMEGRDPRLTGLRLQVTMRAEPADRVAQLQAAWAARCPALLVLTEPAEVQVEWSS